MSQIGGQLLGGVGRLTTALSTALGALSSILMILVIGIFIAIEPKLYDRGVAWMLPTEHRDGFYDLSNKVGFTLRRLMFGRIVGMVVEGVGTWLMLMWGGVPMAALLGLLTGLLAFIPNIGAIVSGVLMVAVGFSAGTDAGLWAIATYFIVQTIDGYLIVPYVARRTVDLAPALVLAAQLLFGVLFGLMGLLLADPIVATIKVSLEEWSKRRAGRRARSSSSDAATAEAYRGSTRCLSLRRRRRGALLLHLLLHRCICCCCCAARIAALRHDLDDVDVEIEVGVGLEPALRRRVGAIGEAARDDDLVAAAFLHLEQRLAEAGDDLADQHRRRAAALGAVEHRAVLGRAGIFEHHAVEVGQQPARARRDGVDVERLEAAPRRVARAGRRRATSSGDRQPIFELRAASDRAKRNLGDRHGKSSRRGKRRKRSAP